MRGIREAGFGPPSAPASACHSATDENAGPATLKDGTPSLLVLARFRDRDFIVSGAVDVAYNV